MNTSFSSVTAFLTCLLFFQPRSVQADVNWPSLQAKVNEIKELLGTIGIQIKLLTKSADATVEEAISPTIEKGLTKCVAIFENVSAFIEDQKLTIAGAEDFVEEIKSIYTGLIKDTEDEIGRLSKEDAQKIEEVWYGGFAQLDAKSQEGYALLRAGAP